MELRVVFDEECDSRELRRRELLTGLDRETVSVHWSALTQAGGVPGKIQASGRGFGGAGYPVTHIFGTLACDARHSCLGLRGAVATQCVSDGRESAFCL
jgi:DNA-binding transcriptional ArsR family regulator